MARRDPRMVWPADARWRDPVQRRATPGARWGASAYYPFKPPPSWFESAKELVHGLLQLRHHGDRRRHRWDCYGDADFGEVPAVQDRGRGEGGGAGGAPERAQLRRHPLGHLLCAGVAEGAELRERGAEAAEVLR